MSFARQGSAAGLDREGIAAACRRFGVGRLDLIGSWGTEAFDPGRSDVDLIAEFEDRRGRSFLSDYAGLRDALVRIFGMEVDLRAAGPMDNPYFRASVERQRRPLYP